MEVRCIICDYDLRELDPAGNCPECGTPIERSLKGDLLRYADTTWLEVVHRGLRLIAWAMWGIVAVILIMVCGGIVEAIATSLGYAILDEATEYLAWPVNFIWLVTGCFVFAGLWFASTPEPRDINKDSVLPVVFRAVSLLVILAIGFEVVTGPDIASQAIPTWLDITLAAITFVLFVVHATMFNDLLQSLDGRCAEKDEKRRKLLTTYRKQGLGCAGIVAVFVVVVAISRYFSGKTVDVRGLNLMLLLWLAVLSFARGTAQRIAHERRAAEAQPAVHVAMASND
jgi:MFS family permease